MTSPLELDRALQLEGCMLARKWRVERRIGAGGTSVVYEATHRNGKRVALKVLTDRLAADVRARKRFLREGYLANRVGHPGAVAVLDDDTHGEIPFLVMELLEGETLDRRWVRANRSMPVDTTVSVVVQVLEIVRAAHAAGVIHRDVKPSNVFLTHDGTVKLLDFGLARLESTTADAQAMSVTSSAAWMGTPAFMAPEQARGRWEEVDARTDLWAVGAVAYTMLAGRHVHVGETQTEVIIAAATQPAPSLRTMARHVPAPIAKVIDRALSFDRSQRFPDAAAMLDALRGARVQSADTQPGEDGPSTATSPERVTVGTSSAPPIAAVSSDDGSSSGAAVIPALSKNGSRAPAAAAVIAAMVGVGVYFGGYHVRPEITPGRSTPVATAQPGEDAAPVAAASSATQEVAVATACATATPNVPAFPPPKPRAKKLEASAAAPAPPPTAAPELDVLERRK